MCKPKLWWLHLQLYNIGAKYYIIKVNKNAINIHIEFLQSQESSVAIFPISKPCFGNNQISHCYIIFYFLGIIYGFK